MTWHLRKHVCTLMGATALAWAGKTYYRKKEFLMQWSQYKRQLAGSLLATAAGALLPGSAACAEESAAAARESWERMRQTRPAQPARG